MNQAWAVYHKQFRLTKKPMTQYDAENAKLHWSRCFNNLEVREVRR